MPGQFQRTPRQMWRMAVMRLPVTASHRLVLLLIAEGANRDGERALAGVDYLSETLHVDRSVVTTALAWARKHGWLECTQRGQRGLGASVYRLVFPDWYTAPAKPAGASSPAGRTSPAPWEEDDPF